jgi:hypothetical protein
VPYPAGAVLFRDYHVRDALAYAAPYLTEDAGDGFGGFLGRWTLEGSRPGAPAVSAYLSQAVVPLDQSGHGALVRDCLSAMRSLVRALRRRFDQSAPAAFVPFAEPDTIGLCFALVPRSGARSLATLNAFTRSVWQSVAVDGRDDLGHYPFILSKTEVSVPDYGPQLVTMFGPEALEHPDAETVLLLRVFTINPFLRDWSQRTPPFDDLFCDYLNGVVERIGEAGGERLERG